MGIDGEAVIVPGDPMRSIVLHRAALVGAGAMPPLAKNRVDDAGVALLEEWILELGGIASPVDNALASEDDPGLY